MSELTPRPVSRSLTTMTQFVLPSNANAMGNVFGGQILSWMDLCGAICAQRHTGRIVVTAGIDDLSFERGVRVGEVVHLEAKVTGAFHSSLEIEVLVHGEDATRGQRWSCVSAFMTFVALDDARRPTAIPPLALCSDEERTLAREADERRLARLARRKPGRT
jgi:acyl-CoA hydrolase